MVAGQNFTRQAPNIAIAPRIAWKKRARKGLWMKRDIEKFNRRMNLIPKKVREAAQKQIEINAAELAALQKTFAPRDDGALISSIEWKPLINGHIGAQVLAGGEKTTRPVRQGQSATYDYALAAQFGREGQAGSNFFFGPYRLNKRKFKARITRAISKAIKS